MKNLVGIQDKRESLYHIVWDPFHSVTKSRYQTKYSVLSGEGANLQTDCKRSKRGGRYGRHKPTGPCACMSRAKGDKTTVTPVDMVVHIITMKGCHFRK